MGIKFHCPNGHKIHVKAFLAGNRGICPKCGVKVDIPNQSEPGLISRSAPAHAAEAEESDDITLGLAEEPDIPKSEPPRHGSRAPGPATPVLGNDQPSQPAVSNVDDILSAYSTGDAVSAGPLLSRPRSFSSKASTGIALLVIAMVLAIVLLFVLFGRHEPPADTKPSAIVRSDTVATAQREWPNRSIH